MLPIGQLVRLQDSRCHLPNWCGSRTAAVSWPIGAAARQPLSLGQLLRLQDSRCHLHNWCGQMVQHRCCQLANWCGCRTAAVTWPTGTARWCNIDAVTWPTGAAAGQSLSLAQLVRQQDSRFHFSNWCGNMVQHRCCHLPNWCGSRTAAVTWPTAAAAG